MKNFTKCSILLLMLLTIVPFQSIGAKEKPKAENKIESAEAKLLTERIVQIKEMDKSAMTRSEKKVLRKEVSKIKTKLASLNGGVYLTTGGIIIIILLLILLL